MDKKHAGVDWAKEEHALCVVDETGRRLLQRRFAHDERGLGGLCRSLADHGVRRVAIERPDGVLVERLLEAGLAVLPIHPNQMKAATGPAFAPRAASPTASTLSCWRSWPAPTTTVSAPLPPTPTRPGR